MALSFCFCWLLVQAGDYAYKESLYYLGSVNGVKCETRIFFFKGVCSNIKLDWHIKHNPSLRNGYIAAENLMAHIKNQYPGLEFEESESKLYANKYVMRVSDTVSIVIERDSEVVHCQIEDSLLQEPYWKLEKKVDALVKKLKEN